MNLGLIIETILAVLNNFTKKRLGRYCYQLYNLNGRLIESKILTGEETTISMQELIPSSYILKVFGEQEELKTFKIIKR